MQCSVWGDKEKDGNTDSVRIESGELARRLPRKSSHSLGTTHDSQVECQEFSTAVRPKYPSGSRGLLEALLCSTPRVKQVLHATDGVGAGDIMEPQRAPHVSRERNGKMDGLE